MSTEGTVTDISATVGVCTHNDSEVLGLVQLEVDVVAVFLKIRDAHTRIVT